MGISFDGIPSSLLIPAIIGEFDSTRAQQGLALMPYTGLIIGQKTDDGTADADSIHRVTSAAQVAELAGLGSMLHRQAKRWFKANSFTETWILVLADADAGVAATAQVTFSGPATANGTLNFYVGSERVQIGVAAGDTDEDISEAFTDAVNAQVELLCTASQDDEDTNLTFNHKGEAGNDLDLRINYRDGEKTPAGVGVTITAFAGGLTNPSLSAGIAALGDRWFHVWTHPYTDGDSLTVLETELFDRAGPLRSIDGVAITSANGTQGDLADLGETRNCQFNWIQAQPGKNPLVPPLEYAATVAATVAFYANPDPARPLQTLALDGLLPPAQDDWFTNQERDLLLHDGIGTSRVGAGGIVRLERVITTYQKNAADAPDTAYRDGATVLVLQLARYSWATRVRTRYPRHKLADDGTRFAPGQAVVTPSTIKAEACMWFRDMEEAGQFEGFDQFKKDLVVVRNDSDVNRVDMILSPDIVNQFIVGAFKLKFLL